MNLKNTGKKEKIYIFNIAVAALSTIPIFAAANVYAEYIDSKTKYISVLEQISAISELKKAEYQTASLEVIDAKCHLEEIIIRNKLINPENSDKNMVFLQRLSSAHDKFCKNISSSLEISGNTLDREKEDYKENSVKFQIDMDQSQTQIITEFAKNGFIYYPLSIPFNKRKIEVNLRDLCTEAKTYLPTTPVFDDLESISIGKIKPEYTESIGKRIILNGNSSYISFNIVSYDQILGFFDDYEGNVHDTILSTDGTIYHNYTATENDAKKRIEMYKKTSKDSILTTDEYTVYNATQDWFEEAKKKGSNSNPEELEQKAFEIGVDRIRNALVHCYTPLFQLTHDQDVMFSHAKECTIKEFGHNEGEVIRIQRK